MESSYVHWDLATESVIAVRAGLPVLHGCILPQPLAVLGTPQLTRLPCLCSRFALKLPCTCSGMFSCFQTRETPPI